MRDESPRWWRRQQRDKFDNWWRQLAVRGSCDALGGREYCRVYREWVAMGRPPDVRAFILESANRPSDSPNWPTPTDPAS
jgi:hypothetical protein